MNAVKLEETTVKSWAVAVRDETMTRYGDSEDTMMATRYDVNDKTEAVILM